MSVVTPTKRRNGNKPSPSQNEKRRVRNSSVTVLLAEEERSKREKSLANASRALNGAVLGLTIAKEGESGFRTLCKRAEKAEDVLSADELTLQQSKTTISITNGEYRKLRKLISGAYGATGKERAKARAKLLAYVQKLNGPKKVSTRK